MLNIIVMALLLYGAIASYILWRQHDSKAAQVRSDLNDTGIDSGPAFMKSLGLEEFPASPLTKYELMVAHGEHWAQHASYLLSWVLGAAAPTLLVFMVTNHAHAPLLIRLVTGLVLVAVIVNGFWFYPSSIQLAEAEAAEYGRYTKRLSDQWVTVKLVWVVYAFFGVGFLIHSFFM
jgi:hypothetical protein